MSVSKPEKESPVRSRLASNLKLLRKKRGLSQEALAFEANIARTYLSDVERGKRNISIDNLQKLAKALKVDLAELLGDYSEEDQRK